ncbi:MAG: hypothetical protein ACFE0J_20595, partial [Elainellaceae cyanobacterium]
MTQVKDYRGIEFIETTDSMILVKNSLNSVSSAVRQLNHLSRWERNIYSREILISELGFIIFQFRRHFWTIIQFVDSLAYSKYESDAEILSKYLNTPALYYSVGDTFGDFQYTFFSNGICVEKLRVEESEGLVFESVLRPSVSIENIKSRYQFVNDFFIKQDIYIPVLSSNISLTQETSSQRVVLELWNTFSNKPQKFRYSDFEGFDYLATN